MVSSDDEDIDWDPHAHHEDVTPLYVTDEDANLDDPDDNELEEKDVQLNTSLKSFAAIIKGDGWVPNGKSMADSNPNHFEVFPYLLSTSHTTYISSCSSSPTLLDLGNHNVGPQSLDEPNDVAVLPASAMAPTMITHILWSHATDPVVEDGMDLEDEDEEINELMQGHGASSPSEVQDWLYLCDEINGVLRKENKACSLPFRQLNQYQLLCSFANLHIKGFGQISASLHIAQSEHDQDGAWFAWHIHALACHNEKYEQLPIECHGGRQKGSCHWDDEDVKKGA
ncbi:hypothetical protein BS47DRAFT_1361330 [Hydnum rufescens UP504]|uniref:Uncharacterized protein n=1 Tax=Hydnum rufescens UP504 TaxID=1448309 RepID=A0A9P6AZJ0_9AGAM|nr:hypothetical protein BS47DRAFT_1361330 [Hydnum rufescens UP504]